SFTAVASNGYADVADIQAGIINISATTKTGLGMRVGDLHALDGSLVLKDTGGDIVETGDGHLAGYGGVSLSAKHILDSGSGSLNIAAGGGDITLKGILGATSAA